jgi:5'-3' exonuclease
MGIKNLNKFLRDTTPSVFRESHISAYAYKKIAVDVSLYLFLSKARVQGRPSWIYEFVVLLECLAKHDVHCVFVYDAVGVAHPDKEVERSERRETKEKLTDKLVELDDAMRELENTGVVPELLLEFQEQKKLSIQPLLSKNTVFNKAGVENEIQKLKGQLFTVTKKDFELTRELCRVLRVPTINAPLEAEALCSHLSKIGAVDGVLSRDTDVLAYGGKTLIAELDTRSGAIKEIVHAEMLSALCLTESEFLDFCIMCGTDYNKNIPKIGPVNAYKLIREHSSIDALGALGLDVSILKHVRVRELFSDYDKGFVTRVEYCGLPDMEELELFLIKNNVRSYNLPSLRSSFIKEITVDTSCDE